MNANANGVSIVLVWRFQCLKELLVAGARRGVDWAGVSFCGAQDLERERDAERSLLNVTCHTCGTMKK